MKIALIGQDIPQLLPSLLADVYYAEREPAEICAEERNDAMRAVLSRYGSAVVDRAGIGGSFTALGDRLDVLRGADCVVYDGDYLAASRFRMDREALSGGGADEPGLTDQARQDGGIGGLMHALRQGQKIRELCDVMDAVCPKAMVVTLGRPVARTARMFLQRGYRCYGLGPSPWKGAGGVEGIADRLGRKANEVTAVTAGLPGFAFLVSLRDRRTNADLLPEAVALAEEGGLGRLPRRWLAAWDSLAVGSANDHAEFLPAQEDYAPDPDPAFGESVERRKERILHMNTVADKGLRDPDGMTSQLMLLTRAPAQRPGQLAISLLREREAVLPAVTRLNRGAVAGLAPEAVIEATLILRGGKHEPEGWKLSPAVCDICEEIDEANRLAAEAAMGDRSAMREYVEMDPALAGLDRLYLQDVVDRMVHMHSDILTAADDED